MPTERTEREGLIHIGDPRHKTTEFVEEVIGRHDEAFLALTDEFQALITGLCLQFAARRKHDPSFDLREVTFERPRWRNDGGTFEFDINYRGSALQPRNVRWD